MAVLRFQDVDKSFRSDLTFRRRRVLHGVGFEVQRGETFAYLGHNGAGKTTSIKLLLGLLRPDSGRIVVMDRPPADRAALSRIGFVPENPYFYDHLNGREFLRLVADLHGLDRSKARHRGEEILELVSMTDHADRRMRTYSKGMLQRMALGQALVNDPDLLVLDEPMGGLDPVGRHQIRTIIGELKSLGKTIFMSSHILSDVEAVADRAAILSDGQLRRIVDLRDRRHDHRALEIHCRGLCQSTASNLVHARFEVERSGDNARVIVSERERAGEAIAIVQSGGAHLLQVVPARVGLERVFIEEVTRSSAQGAVADDEDSRRQVRRILEQFTGVETERDQEVHS